VIQWPIQTRRLWGRAVK